MDNITPENTSRFDQSIPQEILQARDNAETQSMPKGTIRLGNRAMIEKILNTQIQPYQDNVSAFFVLETVGRKSGQRRQTPLAVFQYQGNRYLIAPSRGRDWVYNLIAVSTATLIVQERREPVQTSLTLDDSAIKALRAYMAFLPDWALRQFPFSVAASDEEIRAKREKFAVFRLS